MRKLFKVEPIDNNSKFEYLPRSKKYFISDDNCETKVCIPESDVDFLIKVGYIREELPKWADDNLMIEFSEYCEQERFEEYYDHGDEPSTKEELLLTFKKSKGIV